MEGGERRKDFRTLGGTEGRGNSKLNQEEEAAGIRGDPTEVDEEMARDPRMLEDKRGGNLKGNEVLLGRAVIC